MIRGNVKFKVLILLSVYNERCPVELVGGSDRDSKRCVVVVVVIVAVARIKVVNIMVST